MYPRIIQIEAPRKAARDAMGRAKAVKDTAWKNFKKESALECLIAKKGKNLIAVLVNLALG